MVKGDDVERAKVFITLSVHGGFTPQQIADMTFEQQIYVTKGLENLLGLEDAPEGTVRTFRNFKDYRRWQTTSLSH